MGASDDRGHAGHNPLVEARDVRIRAIRIIFAIAPIRSRLCPAARLVHHAVASLAGMDQGRVPGPGKGPPLIPSAQAIGTVATHPCISSDRFDRPASGHRLGACVATIG